jgi:hypothetical protein
VRPSSLIVPVVLRTFTGNLTLISKSAVANNDLARAAPQSDSSD